MKVEDTDRELGALAQAARNFIISRKAEDLATLDRLSASALMANRLLPSWSPDELRKSFGGGLR